MPTLSYVNFGIGPLPALGPAGSSVSNHTIVPTVPALPANPNDNGFKIIPFIGDILNKGVQNETNAVLNNPVTQNIIKPYFVNVFFALLFIVLVYVLLIGSNPINDTKNVVTPIVKTIIKSKLKV